MTTEANKAIELLEKVLRMYNGETDGLFNTRQIIDQALALLRKQPDAGEFTRQVRISVELLPEEELSEAAKALKAVVERCCKHIDHQAAENKEYTRRLLSHMRGEGVKATCDIHGDWWYVDDEPIVCPKCRPEQALKAKGGE